MHNHPNGADKGDGWELNLPFPKCFKGPTALRFGQLRHHTESQFTLSCHCKTLRKGQKCRVFWTFQCWKPFGFRGLWSSNHYYCPGSRWWLRPQIPVIGSCSSLAICSRHMFLVTFSRQKIISPYVLESFLSLSSLLLMVICWMLLCRSQHSERCGWRRCTRWIWQI